MSNQTEADQIEEFVRQAGEVSLGQLLKSAWIGFMQGTHTMTPGRIITYDPSTRLASVQPVLQEKYLTEDLPQTIPAIPGVPVGWYMGLPGATILLPDTAIVENTEGMLLVCERSLDLWYKQGGITDPADNRMFDFTDSVFYLGFGSLPNMPTRKGASSSLEVQYGSGWIEITNDSPAKFKIANGAQSLKQIELDIVSMVSNAQAPPGTGGGPLIFTSPNPTSVNAEINGLFK